MLRGGMRTVAAGQRPDRAVSGVQGHAARLAVTTGAVSETWKGRGLSLTEEDLADFGAASEVDSGSIQIGRLDLEARLAGGSQDDFGTYSLGESGELVVDALPRSGSTAIGLSVGSGSRVLGSLSGSASLPVSSASMEIGSGEGEAFGRFRIRGVLGQGEHATVYRAVDALLERDVAIKVPRPGVLRTERALERFLGEARAQARLRHPRIVPVYEAGRAGDRHYIAMALIEGRTLHERLAEDGLPEPGEAARLAAELAGALAYAHGMGVVHRDVKPANVRIDIHGDVFLMDFGIAYRPDSNEMPLPPGTILGTPAYVAPEQAEGGRPNPLPASDQYSLGAVLYELLCGRPPFIGPPSYVLYHAIHCDPPSPCSIEPRVPRALAAICLKALAKDPERRYPDCRALADDLRRWLRGESPMAHRRTWVRLGR